MYIYVVKPKYITEACEELEQVSDVRENLIFSDRLVKDICFALDIWFNPQVVSFNSINDAVKILRHAGKYWYHAPLTNIRRAHLISEKLIKLPNLVRNFPIEKELPKIGCFSLIDKNTLLFSQQRWKDWPLGHCFFKEDKVNPPNRAYLKLWESLTLLKKLPKPYETVIDLGSSPGGWTYVMNSFLTNIISVDKALLDPKIKDLPNIKFLKQSAFSLNPKEYDNVDWLLCDIACYPEKLYNMTKLWLQNNNVNQFIFTIKLQGKTDFSILKKFQEIPNSRVLNLFFNKHEATFIYPFE